MKKNTFALTGFIAFFLISSVASAQPVTTVSLQTAGSPQDARLQLPEGFTSTIVADSLIGARHMAVNKQGGLYIKLSKLKDGKGIIYLKDKNGDGRFDEQTAFGDYPGTGIFIRDNYLYASSNDDVYRYKLDKKGEVLNPVAPEKIIRGLVNRNRDNSKSLAVDKKGNIYVNVGSYVHACAVAPNVKKAPYPCPMLDSVGGIWQFKVNKLNQQYADGLRYATGFKNVVGLDWNDRTNSLFITEHGRDALSTLFPEIYSAEQSGLLPAETMYEVKKGTVGGWPYVYYDQFQGKKILSPEYGGDGKKTGEDASVDPIVTFPAHLAPNGLLFYTGKKFPKKYRHGAFIAFHGRSPELQKGYLVGFVPFNRNKPEGKWDVFADQFAVEKDVRKPCGLAEAPDGSIYVCDDAKGRIYKIQYQ